MIRYKPYLWPMEKPFYAKDFKLGILGGGQLGRMLLTPAIRYDIKVSVLDPDPDAPCSRIAHEFICGDFRDYDTVIKFGESCDVVTVEIEHVNTTALRDLAERGVRVFPQPEVLETIQDKGLQKQFYKKNNIPSAPFRLVENKADVKAAKDFLPFVQKLRKGGYDGRGVQVIHTEADMEKAFDAPSVLEKFVDFEKEIAAVVARNEVGEISVFPPVELVFNPEANLVEFLSAPANISAEVTARIEEITLQTVRAYGIVGIMAIEFFMTAAGDVFVNEAAPRPHNSGHHTIEANVTSQYEQHLRAIHGMPLGSTEQHKHAAMVNLLGSAGHAGPVHYEGLTEVLSIPEVYVHIYGKAVTKPFRKMGHVTATAASQSEAAKRALNARQIIQVKTT